mgnify:CR=1 FL=1
MYTSLKQETIPDEVYREAQLSDAFMLVARAKLSATIKHFDHNVDVTEIPYFCSDCDEVIDGR